MSDMIEICNRICKFLPENYEIELHFENGAAWVELYKKNYLDSGVKFNEKSFYYTKIDLPDAADKTIVQQLNDAVCVANGFDIS